MFHRVNMANTVLQVSYHNNSKSRRLYCTEEQICTWARFVATIKSKIEALTNEDIGIQYKDPDSHNWIVMSHDDFEVLDLLSRAKVPTARQYKWIELSIFQGRSPQVICISILFDKHTFRWQIFKI